MTMGWSIAGGLIADVASSLLSHKSADDSSAIQYKYQSKLNKKNYNYNVKLINLQNAFNEAMMDKANAFNAEYWNKSVDLSNTAHQREVADLRSAGLNPVLSANGGATTVNPIQSAQTSSGNSQLSSSAGLPDVDYLSAMNTAVNMRNSTKITNSQLKNDETNRDSIEGHLNIDRNNSASQIAKNKQEIEASKQKVKNDTAVAQATVRKLDADAQLAHTSSARQQADTVYLGQKTKESQNEVKHYAVQRGVSLGKFGTVGWTTHPNEDKMPTLKVTGYHYETINGRRVKVSNGAIK